MKIADLKKLLESYDDIEECFGIEIRKAYLPGKTEYTEYILVKTKENTNPHNTISF